MKNKNIGYILFDLLTIATPLILDDVASELVWWFGTVLVVISILSIIVVLSSKKEDETIQNMLKKRKEKHRLWIYYDVISDIAIALSWASIGRYEVGFLLIVVKLSILINIPEYYERESK